MKCEQFGMSTAHTEGPGFQLHCIFVLFFTLSDGFELKKKDLLLFVVSIFHFPNVHVTLCGPG